MREWFWAGGVVSALQFEEGSFDMSLYQQVFSSIVASLFIFVSKSSVDKNMYFRLLCYCSKMYGGHFYSN